MARWAARLAEASRIRVQSVRRIGLAKENKWNLRFGLDGETALLCREMRIGGGKSGYNSRL